MSAKTRYHLVIDPRQVVLAIHGGDLGDLREALRAASTLNAEQGAGSASVLTIVTDQPVTCGAFAPQDGHVIERDPPAPRKVGPTVKATIEVEADQIRNILQTAVDAGRTYGIGYWGADLTWADHGTVKACVWEHNGERGRDAWTLHQLDIERGLRMTLCDPPTGWSIETNDKGVIEISVDGPAADYFIQFAAFGEQRYS